ncbi:MAG: hypothetical protein HKN08_03905, partial [Gammaproteobacteria bacterium]|nr:hypothetical protein [Gammaproteobacteria bacterium]
MTLDKLIFRVVTIMMVIGIINGCTVVKVVDTTAKAAVGLTANTVKAAGQTVRAVLPYA